jgi:tartrate dehydrogenase/decarboxylase/D-malate dehydrogenase
MLRHLGEHTAAADVDAAVLELLEQGEILTPDLGGSSTTESVGDAIAQLVSTSS